MTRINAVLAGLCFATLAITAAAQEEAPTVYTYASYFTCPGGSLAKADAEIAADADRMDGLVEDGTITRWGYLAHHTGGSWQRIFYHQANSLDALLDASDAIQEAGDDDEDGEKADDEGPSFGEICNRHDDYIWQVENGTAGMERGAAGFSVYHVCDVAREERADEIVTEHVAPVLNKLVEDGKLTSWGWSSHVVGGKYRKLQTMTAADHKSLLAARTEAIEAMYGEDDAAGEEFTEICGPHADYMWNIVHETP